MPNKHVIEPASADSAVVASPLDVRELVVMLVKHYGLHQGRYDLFLEYQFAFGNFGPAPEQLLPSAVLGISHFGLIAVAEGSKGGPFTVDAAIVNPASKPGKKAKAT